MADRKGVQLIQAFDDGAKTYLQFTHAPAEPVVIESNTDHKPLAYLGDGPYLVVQGVYERLAVSVGTHSAVVTNDSAVARAAHAAASGPVVTPAAASVQGEKAQSEELRAKLEHSRRASPSSNPPSPKRTPPGAGRRSLSAAVMFRRGSSFASRITAVRWRSTTGFCTRWGAVR